MAEDACIGRQEMAMARLWLWQDSNGDFCDFSYLAKPLHSSCKRDSSLERTSRAGGTQSEMIQA